MSSSPRKRTPGTPTKVRARREQILFDEIPTRDVNSRQAHQNNVTRMPHAARSLSKQNEIQHNFVVNRRTMREFRRMRHTRSYSDNAYRRHQRRMQPSGHRRASSCSNVSCNASTSEYARNNSGISMDSKRSTLSRNIFNLWKHGQMCDVIINAGGSRFYAHRLVMAAVCDDFARHQQAAQTTLEFNIPNVRARVMKDVIAYFYTGKLDVTYSNLADILTISQHLGISELKDKCSRLLGNVDNNTAIRNYKIAREFGFENAVRATNSFIHDNFLSLTPSAEFLNIDFRLLYDIVSSDTLNAPDELRVFQACVRWLEHNWLERRKYVVPLMGLVRFGLIAPRDLSCFAEPKTFIFDIPQCHEMLFRAYRYHSLNSQTDTTAKRSPEVRIVDSHVPKPVTAVRRSPEVRIADCQVQQPSPVVKRSPEIRITDCQVQPSPTVRRSPEVRIADCQTKKPVPILRRPPPEILPADIVIHGPATNSLTQFPPTDQNISEFERKAGASPRPSRSPRIKFTRWPLFEEKPHPPPVDDEQETTCSLAEFPSTSPVIDKFGGRGRRSSRVISDVKPFARSLTEFPETEPTVAEFERKANSIKYSPINFEHTGAHSSHHETRDQADKPVKCAETEFHSTRPTIAKFGGSPRRSVTQFPSTEPVIAKFGRPARVPGRYFRGKQPKKPSITEFPDTEPTIGLFEEKARSNRPTPRVFSRRKSPEPVPTSAEYLEQFYRSSWLAKVHQSPVKHKYVVHPVHDIANRSVADKKPQTLQPPPPQPPHMTHDNNLPHKAFYRSTNACPPEVPNTIPSMQTTIHGGSSSGDSDVTETDAERDATKVSQLGLKRSLSTYSRASSVSQGLDQTTSSLDRRFSSVGYDRNFPLPPSDSQLNQLSGNALNELVKSASKISRSSRASHPTHPGSDEGVTSHSSGSRSRSNQSVAQASNDSASNHNILPTQRKIQSADDLADNIASRISLPRTGSRLSREDMARFNDVFWPRKVSQVSVEDQVHELQETGSRMPLIEDIGSEDKSSAENSDTEANTTEPEEEPEEKPTERKPSFLRRIASKITSLSPRSLAIMRHWTKSQDEGLNSDRRSVASNDNVSVHSIERVASKNHGSGTQLSDIDEVPEVDPSRRSSMNDVPTLGSFLQDSLETQSLASGEAQPVRARSKSVSDVPSMTSRASREGLITQEDGETSHKSSAMNTSLRISLQKSVSRASQLSERDMYTRTSKSSVQRTVSRQLHDPDLPFENSRRQSQITVNNQTSRMSHTPVLSRDQSHTSHALSHNAGERPSHELMTAGSRLSCDSQKTPSRASIAEHHVTSFHGSHHSGSRTSHKGTGSEHGDPRSTTSVAKYRLGSRTSNTTIDHDDPSQNSHISVARQSIGSKNSHSSVDHGDNRKHSQTSVTKHTIGSRTSHPNEDQNGPMHNSQASVTRQSYGSKYSHTHQDQVDPERNSQTPFTRQSLGIRASNANVEQSDPVYNSQSSITRQNSRTSHNSSHLDTRHSGLSVNPAAKQSGASINRDHQASSASIIPGPNQSKQSIQSNKSYHSQTSARDMSQSRVQVMASMMENTVPIPNELELQGKVSRASLKTVTNSGSTLNCVHCDGNGHLNENCSAPHYVSGSNAMHMTSRWGKPSARLVLSPIQSEGSISGTTTTSQGSVGSAPGLPRPPTPRIIMVLGGINPYRSGGDMADNISNSIQQYSPESNTWTVRSHLPVGLYHFALVDLGGQMMVIGGQRTDHQTRSPIKECYTYNVTRDRWHTAAPLKTARTCHAAVELDGFVYAIGGEDCMQMSLCTVERYDPNINTWGFVASMKDARVGPAAVTHRGRILIVGGMLDTDEKFLLDTVEVYDPRKEQWSFRFPLPLAVADAALCEINGVVYMIGGYVMKDRETLSLDTVFQYCDEADTWESFQTLHVPRHNAIAVPMDARIYVIGGESSAAMGHALTNVECIDVESQDHVPEVAPLLAPAHGIGGCLFDPQK